MSFGGKTYLALVGSPNVFHPPFKDHRHYLVYGTVRVETIIKVGCVEPGLEINIGRIQGNVARGTA